MRGLLPDRMGCCNPLSDKSFQMATMSPMRLRMIEDMTIPHRFVCNAATLPPRRLEVQPLFWPISRQTDPRRRARLPSPFGFDGPASWGSLNQAVCALRFFYGVTLGRLIAYNIG